MQWNDRKIVLGVLPMILIVATLVSLVFFWTRYLHIREEAREHAGHKDFPEYAAQELHMTGVQLDSLKKIEAQNGDQVHRHVSEVNDAKVALLGLLSREGISDSAMRPYLVRIGEEQMKLDSSAFRYFERMRKVCREEQKPAFDRMIKEVVVAKGNRHK